MKLPPLKRGLFILKEGRMKTFSKFARFFTEQSRNNEIITPFDMKVITRGLESKGKDIIHLEIGEPDFDTPENIKRAGIEAIEKGFTHYAPSRGLLELREEVAKYVSATRKISVSPDEVVIVPGGKNVIFYTMMALLEKGDEVIVQSPGYYPYEIDASLFGAKIVPLPLREENGFSFDRDYFKKIVSEKTKLFVLISPANPTGNIFSKEDIEFISEQAMKNDFYVLSDEIYSRIVYEGEFFSIASVPGMRERTIILDGFSKTYAMTGWRLGYSIAPKNISDIFNKFLVSSNSCTATFTQIAGLEALRGPQDTVDEMVAEYKRRRDFIVDALNEIRGIRVVKPKGAFYVFPNITGLGISSREFVMKLLQNGVATIPGNTFGKYGEGFIRISYANSLENLKIAAERIQKTAEELS